MFDFDDKYKEAVAETWTHLINGESTNNSVVRPEILASWKRSRDYKIDPFHTKAANIGKDRIRDSAVENSELIRVGRPYMEKLYSIVEGSGFYLMITDRNGVILDLTGDPDIVREGAEKTNLVVGADRSERCVGTNAIGTSLAIGKPIQIWSDEHYIKQHKIYACSAAPIYGAEDEIIGCLNLTGLAENVHVHTLGMVISAADGISKEIEIHRAYADIALMNAESDAGLEGVRKGFIRLAGKVGGFTARFTFGDIIAESAEMKQIIAAAKKAAHGNSNILILGESGTGKELVAHAIHNESAYRGGPFVAINCGALPASLIESELFGYAPGAFTGADKNGNPGKFELADGGTIFLDEIANMPPGVQATLLRVIQSREVTRIGANYSKKLDVRIIAATNSDIEAQVESGNFREDLFYRLNVIQLRLPPLRDRSEDIRPLVEAIAIMKGAAPDAEGHLVSDDAIILLASYAWPGNVRELENVIERAVNHADGTPIGLRHLPEAILHTAVRGAPAAAENEKRSQKAAIPLHIEARDREAIREALAASEGNVSKAATLLGVSRRTLYRKMDKYGIVNPRA